MTHRSAANMNTETNLLVDQTLFTWPHSRETESIEDSQGWNRAESVSTFLVSMTPFLSGITERKYIE